MSIKALVGKRMEKNVKFLGTDVKISKLSVEQVLEIQEQAKALNEDEEGGLNLLQTIIRSSVDGGQDLTDEDFKGFPMDELSKLSGEIMKFSGLNNDAAGKSN